MKIGILGGTFNPPHIGHQILAAEALNQIGLDHVLWVLTSYPPHKNQRNITPVEFRLRMVEMTIDDNPKFILSRVDIDREPPYYAGDTVKILKNQSPKNEFYYLMGLDSLNDLPVWHNPADFIAACDGLIVMMRKRVGLNTKKLEKEIPGLKEKLYFLKTPIIDISSSNIRERVNKNEPYRYFVPDKVYRYIERNRLFID